MMETEGSYKSPAVGYVLTASEGEQRSLTLDRGSANALQ
jgi:hypothetical protein